MSETSIFEFITRPLKPYLAVLLMLTGLYSLFINVKLETRQNRLRAAACARVAGWIYFIAGAALLAVLWF